VEDMLSGSKIRLETKEVKEVLVYREMSIGKVI
jgi:hypothetical protein